MIRENIEKLVPNYGKIIFTKALAEEELSVFYTDEDKDTPLQYGRVLSFNAVDNNTVINQGDLIIYSDYYADDIEDTEGYIASVITKSDIHAVLPASEVVPLEDN